MSTGTQGVWMVAARDVHPVRDQRRQLGDRGCAKFRSVLRVSGAGAPDFDLKSRACRTRLGNRARHRRARPSSNQAIAIPAINSRCRRDHRLRTGAARLKPNSRGNSDAAHRASDADQKADQPAPPRGRPTTKTGSQPTEQERPAHRCSPKAPVPDGHTVCPAETPSEQNNTRTLAVFMPDTNTNPVLASGPPERNAS